MGSFALAVIRTAAILLRRWFRRQDADLRGQVALVTGAGRGLGRQVALKLASRGCHVVCVDVDSVANEATAGLIAAEHGAESASSVTCDVSARLQVLEMSTRVLKERGRVDLLVNNTNSAESLSSDTVVDTISADLMHHFWTVLAFLPAMVARDRGHVVLTAGISRWTVVGLTEALSEELRLYSSSVKLSCVTSQGDVCFSIPELAAEEILSSVYSS